MYGYNYFSVQGNFKSIDENGQMVNAKEIFLTESANFADAENTVSFLLHETSQDPESVDVCKISRLDKVKNLLYSDILEVAPSDKEGYMEYSIRRDAGITLFSAKVQFEEIVKDKVKTHTETYLVPAKSATGAESHLRTYLKDSVLDFKIPDINGTKYDTILVLDATHHDLVASYDLIKHRL